jgi:hypothetical protein
MFNSEFEAWTSAVSIILFNKGYTLTVDSAMWDEIEFLFEDDASPAEAVDYLLS